MFFFFNVFVGHILLFTGDTVLFRGPFPQVHQSASLGAERPERIPVPGCFFLTTRTIMFLSLVFHVLAWSLIDCLLSPVSCLLSPVSCLLIYFSTYLIGISTHPFTYGMGAARYTALMEALSSIS